MSEALYELDSLDDSKHGELYKTLANITWIIEFAFKDKNSPDKSRKFCFAGFCIHGSGLIMSCAHLVLSHSTKFFKVRMLDKKDWYDAEMAYSKKSWDILLLKIVERPKNIAGIYEIGTFASSGALTEGQILLHMGHSLSGSYFIGRVTSPCVNATLPTVERTCKTYKPTGYENIVSHRTMGHVWNNDFFRLYKLSKGCEHHAKDFNPLVPIIEFNGFTALVGSLGGPMVNTEGEIVGMIVGVENERVAIHVSALKSISDAYTASAEFKDHLAKLEKKEKEKVQKKEEEKALAELKANAQQKGHIGGSGIKK